MFGRIALRICILGLSPFAALAAVSHASPPLHILIDPGHGGKDHGTTKDDVSEADITLNVARRLAARLARDKRFQVELTRAEDRTVFLGTRSRRARESHADLFLSIHVNSSPEAKARGAEFYFQNQLPPDEESMFLAHKENEADKSESDGTGRDTKFVYDFLEKSHYPPEVTAVVSDLMDSDRVLRSAQLSKALRLSWHGGNHKIKSNSVRQAPFFVLSQMTIPSTLVELGFLTNSEDYHDLTVEASQTKMAEDLYRGLVRYVENQR